MNYYNPYFSFPYASVPTSSGGILSRIFKNGINWGTILTNTQKTLGIINQGIPMIKQVTPLLNNAKTMFKVMNEFKKVDTPQNVNTKSESSVIEPITNNNDNTSNNINYNGPTFYI